MHHNRPSVNIHTSLVMKPRNQPASLLEQRSKVLNSLGLAECAGAQLNLEALFGAEHEEMRQPPILAEMRFRIVEQIFTLFSLVRKVEPGHVAECGEAK